jgi:hypothetical protein
MRHAIPNASRSCQPLVAKPLTNGSPDGSPLLLND